MTESARMCQPFRSLLLDFPTASLLADLVHRRGLSVRQIVLSTAVLCRPQQHLAHAKRAAEAELSSIVATHHSRAA